MRLPASVRFPFGYVVRVRLVTAAEMESAESCCNCFAKPDEVPDGSWDCSERTIRICKGQPVTRQRYILGHELQHALLDFNHHHLNAGSMKP